MATQKKKAVSKRKKPPGRPNGRPTKLTVSVSARIVKAVALGLSYRDAATAGGVHEHTLEEWRTRGYRERGSSSIYARFMGQVDRAAEKTAISYLEVVRKSIMESPVKVRKHIKKDESGKVILTEIHTETLPPDIKGACGGLSAASPSSSAAVSRWSMRARSPCKRRRPRSASSRSNW